MLDPIGEKFGKLVVLERVDYRGGHIYYKCLCDCQNEHICTRNNLLRGISSQCRKCSATQRATTNTVNGANKFKYTYQTYKSILLRITSHVNYIGMYVDPLWLEPVMGFVNFMKDMGERPQGTTIDRIDNSKGYYKENCRWATYTVQNHNKYYRKNGYRGVIKNRNSWGVLLNYEGQPYAYTCYTEIDAATLYDNLSEHFYGDRPNGTTARTVELYVKPIGGVSFDKKSKRYRVRVHDILGNRKTIGHFDTEEEAKDVLDFIRDFVNNK